MGGKEKEMKQEIADVLNELISKRPPLLDENGEHIRMSGGGTFHWMYAREFGHYGGASSNWHRQFKMAKLMAEMAGKIE